jgi:hypothetical protein
MPLETSDIPTSDSSLEELKARLFIAMRGKNCAVQCAQILREMTPVKMHKNAIVCTKKCDLGLVVVQRQTGQVETRENQTSNSSPYRSTLLVGFSPTDP